MLHWLVCYKPAGQSFPDFGVWVSVDFDSKYKILWGETRDHGVPIHERKKKKFKTRIYIINPKFPPCGSTGLLVPYLHVPLLRVQ